MNKYRKEEAEEEEEEEEEEIETFQILIEDVVCLHLQHERKRRPFHFFYIFAVSRFDLQFNCCPFLLVVVVAVAAAAAAVVVAAAAAVVVAAVVVESSAGGQRPLSAVGSISFTSLPTQLSSQLPSRL